jgi:hypothetical protein
MTGSVGKMRYFTAGARKNVHEAMDAVDIAYRLPGVSRRPMNRDKLRAKIRSTLKPNGSLA